MKQSLLNIVVIAMIPLVLTAMVARAVQPIPIHARQTMDVLSGTDWREPTLELNRLSSALAILTLPNLGISRDRMQHSLTGKVWQRIAQAMSEQDWSEIISPLLKEFQDSASWDWQNQLHMIADAKAIQIEVLPDLQSTAKNDWPFTYKLRTIAPNTLPKNDLELEINLGHCLKAMMATGPDGETATIAAALATGGWHNVVLHYSAVLTGKSIHEQFRVPLQQPGVLLSLDPNFLRHIPGQVLSVVAVGFDGNEFLNQFPEWKNPPQDSTITASELINPGIIQGLQGTLFMATSTVGPFQAVMTLGVPRSAATDTAITDILSDIGGSIAEDDSVRLPPIGLPMMMMPALRRVNEYWLLTTSAATQPGPAWADSTVAKQPGLFNSLGGTKNEFERFLRVGLEPIADACSVETA